MSTEHNTFRSDIDDPMIDAVRRHFKSEPGKQLKIARFGDNLWIVWDGQNMLKFSVELRGDIIVASPLYIVDCGT
jgi:hypothetical protein